MKGTLEYDLNDADEKADMELAMNAHKFKIALEEIGEWLRSKTKYGDEREVSFEVLRKEFWRHVNEAGLSEYFS